MPSPSNSRAQRTNPTQPATNPAATQPADEIALNNKTRSGLNRVTPRAQFEAGLSGAVEFMRDITGAKFVVQWDKLKDLGIDQNTRVKVNLTNVKVGDLVDVILVSAAGKPGVLDYTIEHGAIVILPAKRQ